MLKKKKKEKKATQEAGEGEGYTKIIRKIVDSKTGRVISTEERWVKVGSEEGAAKEEVVYAVGTCETCGRPITQDLLTRHEIRTCIVCGKDTCPACRVNTSPLPLPPKYRGQTICEECLRNFRECQVCGTLYPISELYTCEDCKRLACINHAVTKSVFFFRKKIVCAFCAQPSAPLLPQPQPQPIVQQPVQNWVVCPKCYGRGVIEPSLLEKLSPGALLGSYSVQPKVCPVCNGTGKVLIR